MWLVKQVTEKNKLNSGKFYRYDPRTNRQLGEIMTLEEIVRYCEDRKSDKFARQFLQFMGYLDDHNVTKED